MIPKSLYRVVLALPRRLLFPEAAVLALLLALPWLPELFRHVEPRAPLVLAAVVVAGLGVGLRFGRGRVVHTLLLLTAATAIPMLPPGPARSLAAILVPVNLAAIALLPDRGVTTRGGVVRMAAGIVQAAAVLGLAVTHDPGGRDLLARLPIDGFATEVDAVLVAYATALAVLALLAAVTSTATARGALWATAGALAWQLGHPGGGDYLLAAAGLVLVVATLEDAHALAYRDALTGLPSRRALDELLDRTARGFTVAMVDVDHFKAFNDTHGHDVGDQVLRMVATHLRETGGGARAFRYGGEEFTLVFRGLSLEEARPHLEATRQAIESAEFVVRGPDRPKKKPKRARPPRRPRKTLSVTVSIGAAERKNGGAPAEVVKDADGALYRAKNAGRNRVAAATG